MNTNNFLFLILFSFFGLEINAQCCTEPAYGINSLTDELVSVDPATGNFTVIAPLTGGLDGTGGCQGGDEIIDCEYFATDGEDIYTIDLTTGAGTLFINTGITDFLTSLEVDPTTGILYATSVDFGATQTTLWEIDLVGGTANFIGNSPGSCAISLVIDPNGDAYYIDLCTDNIYPISLATGQATGVGFPLGFNLNFGQDYSFDCPIGSGTIFGYAFNADTFTMQYVSIDPATGTVTLIQDFPTGQIASFAFCIEPEDTGDDIEIVSTMGEWGVICLTIALLTFGIVAIREEKVVLA